MAIGSERPVNDDFRHFYGLELKVMVINANIDLENGLEGNTKSPKHKLMFAARSIFEEAIGEVMSELAISADLDLRTEQGQQDFLTAIQAGGSLALIELRGPEHNSDFFSALQGE